MAEGITLLEAWVKFHTRGADSSQQREVEKSLETFKVGLTSLIGSATAAATAVVSATGEMAKGLFKVYYEAERIGSTTEKVIAFGQAVELAGGSGETAKNDLEKFSQKFRVNPAFREAIKNLGHLSAEDMKDAQSAYIGLSKTLAKERLTDPLTYGRALKFSGQDEATVLAIGRPKFGPAYQDALEIDRGLGAIAEKSVRLNEAWIKVNQHLDMIMKLSSGKWMDIESNMLERFDAFLDKHKELFTKVSDSIAGIFFDDVGKFDDTAFGKRVHNAFWDWLHSIDFTKLKNAFIAFANWLTTGWLADKIKVAFGSLGGAVKTAVGAVERAVGRGAAGGAADESYALDHPGWRPGMPKEQTRAQKERDVGASPLAMPEPKTQEYIKKGGYGPFSHDQTVGAGQDFNIPGQGVEHPISGSASDIPGFEKISSKVSDFPDFTSRKRLLGGKHPTHGELDRTWDMPENQKSKAVEPGLDYNPDKLRGHGGLVDPGFWDKKQFNFDRYLRRSAELSKDIYDRLAMLQARPLGSENRQWHRHDGSKTQDIRVTINSTDPHSAAHETARQLSHLQNQTMRDWRKVG